MKPTNEVFSTSNWGAFPSVYLRSERLFYTPFMLCLERLFHTPYIPLLTSFSPCWMDPISVSGTGRKLILLLHKPLLSHVLHTINRTQAARLPEFFVLRDWISDQMERGQIWRTEIEQRVILYFINSINVYKNVQKNKTGIH